MWSTGTAATTLDANSLLPERAGAELVPLRILNPVYAIWINGLLPRRICNLFGKAANAGADFMKADRPIPISSAQYWREIRIRLLPLMLFLGALGLAILLWNECLIPSAVRLEPGPMTAPLTKTVPDNLGVASEIGGPGTTFVSGQVLRELAP